MSDTKSDTPESQWPDNELSPAKSYRSVWVWVLFAGIVVGVFLAVGRGRPVVAYCAQDQEYAEPIFRKFEKEAAPRGRVRAVFDSEAVKTVGLANRLLAEMRHPACDVFWGNEELRTRQLAARGVWAEGGWSAFGYRSRRIVVNTNSLALDSAPHSLLELTNAAWRGKVALAYPQFGTTATHFLALRQHWGAALWETWCRGIAANKPLLLDGNSAVVKCVGRGEAAVGLTDSDDIAAGRREGLPVAALPMNSETLLIPNTVAVVRAAPHRSAAWALMEFLQRRDVVEKLVACNALEGFAMNEVTAATLKVNWDTLLLDLDASTGQLNRIFLR